MSTDTLFAPTRLGRLELKHHLVMAPMTRSRAVEVSTPNAGMVAYPEIDETCRKSAPTWWPSGAPSSPIRIWWRG